MKPKIVQNEWHSIFKEINARMFLFLQNVHGHLYNVICMITQTNARTHFTKMRIVEPLAHHTCIGVLNVKSWNILHTNITVVSTALLCLYRRVS